MYCEILTMLCNFQESAEDFSGALQQYQLALESLIKILQGNYASGSLPLRVS